MILVMLSIEDFLQTCERRVRCGRIDKEWLGKEVLGMRSSWG